VDHALRLIPLTHPRVIEAIQETPNVPVLSNLPFAALTSGDPTAMNRPGKDRQGDIG